MTGGGRLFRHLGTSFVFLGSAAWLAAVVGWFRGVRRVPVLREVGMGETLRSLLDQDYPGWLEVLAVDDCSTDRTGEIIVGLAAERPERLRTLRVDLLPEGWLGKNHALYRGAEESGGEWLLFTDADVSFSPDCIKYAIHYALRENLDHLTFSPELISWGVALKSFVVAMYAYRPRISGSTVSPLYAVLHPFGTGVLIYAALRSACVALAKGGIEWRGTVFPLRLLKGAARDPDERLREYATVCP